MLLSGINLDHAEVQEMLFQNFQDAIAAPCIASLFQGKETGVQNVFQGGSFAVTEWIAWDNHCVSPAIKIISSRQSESE